MRVRKRGVREYVVPAIIIGGLTFAGVMDYNTHQHYEQKIRNVERELRASETKQDELNRKVKDLEKSNHVLQEKYRASQMQLEATKEDLQATRRALDATMKELNKTRQELAEEKGKKKLSSRGGRFPIRRELTGFEVTWYNDTGKTASGRYTQDGVTVSVDPSIIPLGTWVELEFPDGRILRRRADDTGSAVKGKVVDVYANQPTATLLQWGRVRGVTVRILGKE